MDIKRFICSAVLLVLACGVLPVSAWGQDAAKVDKCGCAAVLAKDTKANTLFEQTHQRLRKWFDLDNETLYQRIQDKSFDAEIGWGPFTAGGGGGSKDEVIQKARQRISQRVDDETQRAVQSSTNEAATTKEAIQAWRDCIVDCINRIAGPISGFSVAVLDSPFGDVVRMRVGFKAYDGYVGPPPKITRVDCFGIANSEEVKSGLMNKVLGQYEPTLRRENAASTTATITVWTDIWGAASIVLPMIPPQDGAKRWAEQVRFAFARGVPVVASAGCFDDGIMVQWSDITDPDFKQANVIEIMASLEPDAYAHRHWWWAVQAHDTNEIKITPELWRKGVHEDIRKKLGIEEMPRETAIYFQIGIAWGPEGQRSFRLVGNRWVAGWLPAEKSPKSRK